MKKHYTYLAVALAALSLSACSSSDDDGIITPPEPSAKSVTLLPSTASEVDFYSNGTNLATRAFGTRGEESVVTFEAIESTSIDRTAETAAAESILKEGTNNKDKINLDFLYYAKDGDLELKIYPVMANTDQHHIFGVFYYNDDNELKKVQLSDDLDPYNLYYTTYGPQVTHSKGFKITIKQGYKFGFYWSGITNDYSTSTTINNKKYGTETYYSKTSLNPVLTEKDWQGNVTKTLEQNRAGTFELNDKTYLGIEDWTDCDYQDIVFVTDKVLKTVDGDNTKPNKDDDDDDPADPEVKKYGASVEVNLALNDPKEKDDYVDAHLSLHVRDTTDIEIFMPIEPQYYVPKDDMMIVMNHEAQNVTLNEGKETFTREIAGQTVTMSIEHATNGIYVKTQGINATVLEYLRENFGDGLTFEVRTHFTTDDGLKLTRQQIMDKLSASTIEFKDREPEVYVNAYGYRYGEREVDGKKQYYVTETVDPWAIKVVPVAASLALRNSPSDLTDYTNSMGKESRLYLYPLKTAAGE